TQSAMSLFLGFDASLVISNWYRAAPETGIAFFLKIISFAAVVASFSIGIAFHETRRASLLMATAYWVSALAGTFVALLPDDRIGPIGTYCFVPNVILLLVVGCLGSRLVAPATVAVLLAGLLALHSVLNTIPAVFFEGPSWRAQIPNGGIQKPTEVNIWPPGWRVTLLPR